MIGIAAALWSASGYIGAFIRAANQIYEVEEDRSFWKLRPLQLVITLVMTVAVAVILDCLVVTGPLATAIGDELGVGDTALTIWSIVKWPLLFVAVVLRDRPALPGLAERPATRAFAGSCPGASSRPCCGSRPRPGFSLYVSNFGSYSSTYGSLAGGIVLLLWLWLTNVAVVFGAQFAAELERDGERRAASRRPRAQPVADRPGRARRGAALLAASRLPR